MFHTRNGFFLKLTITESTLHHNFYLIRKQISFPAAWQSKDLISEYKRLDGKRGPLALVKLALDEKNISCLAENLIQQILYYPPFHESGILEIVNQSNTKSSTTNQTNSTLCGKSQFNDGKIDIFLDPSLEPPGY